MQQLLSGDPIVAGNTMILPPTDPNFLLYPLPQSQAVIATERRPVTARPKRPTSSRTAPPPQRAASARHRPATASVRGAKAALANLRALLDEGYITEGEFGSRRQAILNEATAVSQRFERPTLRPMYGEQQLRQHDRERDSPSGAVFSERPASAFFGASNFEDLRGASGAANGLLVPSQHALPIASLPDGQSVRPTAPAAVAPPPTTLQPPSQPRFTTVFEGTAVARKRALSTAEQVTATATLRACACWRPPECRQESRGGRGGRARSSSDLLCRLSAS